MRIEKAKKRKATPGGLEPPTSALTVLRSNQLSYGALDVVSADRYHYIDSQLLRRIVTRARRRWKERIDLWRTTRPASYRLSSFASPPRPTTTLSKPPRPQSQPDQSVSWARVSSRGVKPVQPGHPCKLLQGSGPEPRRTLGSTICTLDAVLSALFAQYKSVNLLGLIPLGPTGIHSRHTAKVLHRPKAVRLRPSPSPWVSSTCCSSQSYCCSIYAIRTTRSAR